MEKVEKVIAGMLACNGVGEDCNKCPYNGLGKRCSDVLWAEATEVLRNLKTKYATALEMAATATEIAAQAKKVDGDLIRRSDVLKYPLRRDTCDKKNANPHFINGVESVMEYVEALTSVEAEPVVHAHWVKNEDDVGWYRNVVFCSNCDKGEGTIEKPRCPHCGAHMDEEVAE